MNTTTAAVPRVLAEFPLRIQLRPGSPVPLRARDDLDPYSPPLEYEGGRLSWGGYATREERDAARAAEREREAIEARAAAERREVSEQQASAKAKRDTEAAAVRDREPLTVQGVTYHPIVSWRVDESTRFDLDPHSRGSIVQSAWGGPMRSEHGAGDRYLRIEDSSLLSDDPDRIRYYVRERVG